MNCTKCGRELALDIDDAFRDLSRCSDHIQGAEDGSCRRLEVAAAYRRGVLRGVEIAKDETMLDQGRGYGAGGASIDWTDVDRAVREEVGDGT